MSARSLAAGAVRPRRFVRSPSPGLLGACGAPASNARSATWDRYAEASEAYVNCRMQGRARAPCAAEKTASQAAEARYRAEIGAAPPAGR